jgi:hypothetical protein
MYQELLLDKQFQLIFICVPILLLFYVKGLQLGQVLFNHILQLRDNLMYQQLMMQTTIISAPTKQLSV